MKRLADRTPTATLQQGGPWPEHCVAGSHGAKFAASLRLPHYTRLISKATQQDREAYSSFQGTDLDIYRSLQLWLKVNPLTASGSQP